MGSDGFIRRLRAAAKNAVVWGATWFGLSAAGLGAADLAGVSAEGIGPLDIIGMALRIGIAGGMAGGMFSAFISLFYRGRRLSEISPLRFGIGGAIVAVLFVSAFMLGPALFTGDLPPFDLIDGDLLTAALFGGITAGGSMWLARRAEARAAEAQSLDEPGASDRLGAGEPAWMGARPSRQRERVGRDERE